MSTRYRGNFLYGTLSGYNAAQTTFTGIGFPHDMTAGAYLPIVINPGYNGATSSGEIVYITNVTTSGSVDIITISGGRGREGTTPGSGSTGTQWVSGPLASDFGLANQINNSDFPAPAAGGAQVLLSTSTSGGAWSKGNAGQILVTSGTTVTWRTPQAWMNYNENEVGNALNGGSPAITIAVSGYSTYLVTARATVYGKSNSTSCNLRAMITDVTTGSPPGPIATGALYEVGWNLAIGEGAGSEYSISATYQPGTTAAKNIYFIITPVTSPGTGGIVARRAQMNVVGIA